MRSQPANYYTREESMDAAKMSATLMKSGQIMNIDQILLQIGEMGRFQIMLEAIFCFLQLPYTFQILLPYFTQDSPTWRCVANSTVCNVTGALKSDDDLRCSLPRSEWEYTTPKDYSIVTEFDLYCGKGSLALMATSAVFVAWAIGSVALGWTADKYGRWKVLIPSYCTVVLAGLISAFAPNFAVYIVARILVGLALPGVIVEIFVLASEFVGPKFRPLSGILLWGFFGLALVILGTKAYFIRKWKILTIVCTAPYIITFPMLKFIPESVRWLRISGKPDQCLQELRKIAKINRREFPKDVILKPIESESGEEHGTLLDIFRPAKMAIKTVIQGYSWLVEGMVYYSVALAADDIGGTNRYANYILTSLVDFPAVLLAIYTCRRFGRKKTVIYPLLVGSIMCIGAAFVPSKASATVAKHWPLLRIAMGVIGKLCVAISFDSIYTWSVELYPTVVRGEGMGYLQVMSRLGAALAPWVTKALISVKVWLPFLILGSSSFLASILLFWLPETRDQGTAETLEKEEKTAANFNDGVALLQDKVGDEEKV